VKAKVASGIEDTNADKIFLDPKLLCVNPALCFQ